MAALQRLPVATASTISEICAKAKISYDTGYYQVLKSEDVSASKDLVATCDTTGEQVVGGAAVRAKLGLGSGKIKVAPGTVKTGWTLFVQSTSSNRKIPAGSSILVSPIAGASGTVG